MERSGSLENSMGLRTLRAAEWLLILGKSKEGTEKFRHF